jgi:hypothetical protein
MKPTAYGCVGKAYVGRQQDFSPPAANAQAIPSTATARSVPVCVRPLILVIRTLRYSYSNTNRILRLMLDMTFTACLSKSVVGIDHGMLRSILDMAFTSF